MIVISKIKSLLILAFVVLHFIGNTQITSGKIVFERKTNLFKKFAEPQTQKWIGEKNKWKYEDFELYFNDSISLFIPAETTDSDKLSWTTNKNTVYQNLNKGSRISLLTVFGENFVIQDSLRKRTWKITENRRTIAKFSCRQAIWQMDDSTRIYAWYSEDIIPTVGPETYTGLPGAILGLAAEDGRIVYFAKSVEVMKPNFEKLIPKMNLKNATTDAELRSKMISQFGSKKEYMQLIVDLFIW
ncbi:MAG: GLPGLI family protein [Crocinitomicaceae bacterium]|nr:GLPGLI family protein [Crocinitomicaceae bacterium]